MPQIKILEINPGSDGDGRKWPKHHYTRNDGYFKERIATDKWIRDLPGGPEPDVTYRLNKLPNGYAGFERQRPDSKHIDRYIYGHPNGQFRSLNEFYPHFKHLMEYGGPAGCDCRLCKAGFGNAKKGKASTDIDMSERGQLISPFISRPRGRPPKEKWSDSEQPRPQKRKLVDCEGTPDVYETMLSKLKDAGFGGCVDLPMEEKMSPDWRAGFSMTKNSFQEWQKLPRYIPREGELVLFVRTLGNGETLAWDKSSQTFRKMRIQSKSWLEQPKWEAAVVTQMPKEAVSDEDLTMDMAKEHGVNYSGFRVEPLSEPGNEYKPYPKQHKYVPLRVMRPLVLWQECLNGVPQQDWHPSINHALTVTSSLCVVGRYRFKGVWPNATIFAHGVYMGSELILVGDAVRLLPRKIEQSGDAVTDIMVITAVRLRFVNMDFEYDDDLEPDSDGLPYRTCLHLSGRVYTLDPTRSFDSVGKVPIKPDSGVLPPGLSKYGQWYHYSDPQKASARIEVPYTRILGRCFEDTAMKVWFGTQSDMPIPSPFTTVNKVPVITKGDSEISRGLQGLVDARNRSLQNDKRIKSQEGRTWFWSDTRIEQLDLHEVNGRNVGVKNASRTKGDMALWRRTLKALDGKKGALEEYHAARKEQAAEKARDGTAPSFSAYGMLAGGVQSSVESATDADNVEYEDRMEVDDEHDTGVEEDEEQLQATPKKIETITLYDSDDEDDLATNQLAGELAKKIRSNDPRLR